MYILRPDLKLCLKRNSSLRHWRIGALTDFHGHCSRKPWVNVNLWRAALLPHLTPVTWLRRPVPPDTSHPGTAPRAPLLSPMPVFLLSPHARFLQEHQLVVSAESQLPWTLSRGEVMEQPWCPAVWQDVHSTAGPCIQQKIPNTNLDQLPRPKVLSSKCFYLGWYFNAVNNRIPRIV